MATVKKVIEKKTSSKKASATAKASAKKGDKSSGVKPLVIRVPKGGQIIKYFELTPSLPVDGKATDWLLIEEGVKKPRPITNITIGFPENRSALERELERAILVISLNQNSNSTEGTWRFALGGVATDTADSDPNNDIVIDLIDNGLTMLVYVQVLENSVENIDFGYVASFTDAISGVVSIYQSQDPGWQPIRPIGP